MTKALELMLQSILLVREIQERQRVLGTVHLAIYDRELKDRVNGHDGSDHESSLASDDILKHELLGLLHLAPLPLL